MGRSILRVDAGADHVDSITRQLADELVRDLLHEADGDVLVRRDATTGVPLVGREWVAAAFADGDPTHLAISEELIEELMRCDELVLVAPIYNLSIPAALKAWIDQVVRDGRTFHITEDGPQGLATHIRRAWIVTASGGTEVGGALDFNTPYLRTILDFIGIVDVRVVSPVVAARWADPADLRG